MGSPDDLYGSSQSMINFMPVSRKIVSTISFIILLLFQFTFSFAQTNRFVKWNFNSITAPETTIIFSATIAPTWHLYSQNLKKGGPLPTRITFEPSGDYTLIGKMEESGKPVRFYDSVFNMEVTWYSEAVTFSQKIRANRPSPVVKGKVEFMICNGEMCLPPAEQKFSIVVNTAHKSP